MSIPYNDYLSVSNFSAAVPMPAVPAPAVQSEISQTRRAVNELATQTFKQPLVRGVQFVRDALRVVLKVPVRAVFTDPVYFPSNWKGREHALINLKLAGYSFVQLLSVAPKFMVAIAAILTSAISKKKAEWLLDKSNAITAFLDGRASQLEALKEQGLKNINVRSDYDAYKAWVYKIDPALCRG